MSKLLLTRSVVQRKIFSVQCTRALVRPAASRTAVRSLASCHSNRHDITSTFPKFTLFHARGYSVSGTKFGVASHLPSMQIFPYKDLNALQVKSCEEYSDRRLFGTKDGSRFDWVSFGEFGDMVTKFRAVLRAHEVGVDDKVALICNNRVEWAVAYFGIMGVGAQIVPMYEAQTEKDWRYIINDSEAKLVLVANEVIYKKVSPLINTEPHLQSVLSIDSDPQLLHSYGYWMEKVSPEKGKVFKVNIIL